MENCDNNKNEISYHFDLNIFRHRLQVARRKAGFTQEELGKKLGVSKATISNWEAGKRRIRNAELVQLCEVLHVDINYLLGRCVKSESKASEIAGYIPLSSDVIELMMAGRIPPAMIFALNSMLLSEKIVNGMIWVINKLLPHQFDECGEWTREYITINSLDEYEKVTASAPAVKTRRNFGAIFILFFGFIKLMGTIGISKPRKKSNDREKGA